MKTLVEDLRGYFNGGRGSSLLLDTCCVLKFQQKIEELCSIAESTLIPPKILLELKGFNNKGILLDSSMEYIRKNTRTFFDSNFKRTNGELAQKILGDLFLDSKASPADQQLVYSAFSTADDVLYNSSEGKVGIATGDRDIIEPVKSLVYDLEEYRGRVKVFDTYTYNA